MYSITNHNYPGNCGAKLVLPVVEDTAKAMAVKLPFRADLKIGTPFAVAIDEAIQAADRHVYVQGHPPNPLKFVEEWINLLRWEVNNLWEIRPAESCYLWHSGLNLTHEHYKRSGEIIAEGIAIAFLESRLKVPRQRFFFINGAGARPDFIVKLKARHRTALLHNRLRFMVEVRSRQSMCNLSADDHSKLAAKKAVCGMAGVLAVYCCYGPGKHRNGNSRTRIHLADPPGDDPQPASDAEIAEIAIHHYLRITSQIGLWRHRDHLLRAAEARGIAAARFKQPAESDIRLGVVRSERAQAFRGREFNDLLAMASDMPRSVAERDETRRRIRRRVEAGELGSMVFRGLNEKTLQLIEASDWEGLSNYNDAGATEYSVGRWVRSDGVLRSEEQIEPNSNVAREIITSLGSVLQ